MTEPATHPKWTWEEERAQLPAVQAELGEEPQVESKLAPRTTVIIPAYNEEEGIGIVLEKLFAVLDESYEVIVVDDGSIDGTKQAALRFPCRVISRETNGGKAEAMRTGLAAARGELVVFIDADDTYPAEAIPTMAHAMNDYDLVLGSRVLGRNHVPTLNRVGNAIFRSAIRTLYGFRPHDPLSGLYGLKKENLIRMNLESAGFCVESEIAIKAARMGLRVLEVPIEYRPRVGKSKLRGLGDGYRIMQAIVKMLALYNPTLSFLLPGGALFALGLFVMAWLLSGNQSLGSVTLATNSFVLAAMLALAAFQFGVFGFVLKLYGVAHKFTRQDALTGLLTCDHIARNFGMAGLGLVGASVGLAVWLAPGWLSGELDNAGNAKRLVLTSFLGVLGLQMLMSSIFVSIFAREVAHTRAQPATAWEVSVRPGEEQGEGQPRRILTDLWEDKEEAVGLHAKLRGE